MNEQDYKDALIRAISRKDKLLDFLDRYELSCTAQAEKEQLEDFVEEIYRKDE